MAIQAVTVNLPDSVYERLARRAERAHRTMEAELVDTASILPEDADELLPVLCSLFLTDRSLLVRGYAGAAIGAIGEAADWIKLLELGVGRDRSPWVRAFVHVALARRGVAKAFDSLLSALDGRDYHVRCVVANAIVEVCPDARLLEVEGVLRRRLDREKTRAVSSTIRKALEGLASRRTIVAQRNR